MAARTNVARWTLAAALLGAGALSAGLQAQQPSKPVGPSDSRGRQGRQISLKDQLRVGLKAVTKEDLAFIDLVVARVNQGALPRRVVDSTFLWARRRVVTRDKRYFKRPMVYFQPALVQRARAIGVTL